MTSPARSSMVAPDDSAVDGARWLPRRVLVIDDNEAIHSDFRKVLGEVGADELAEEEAILFGETGAIDVGVRFELESALQGQEGYEMVRRAVHDGRPYHMAFVDMRMPPGWDGVETIRRIWDADPGLQVVICTAYSDYSWEQIISRLGNTDRMLFLRKPFDDVEVLQLASALTEKWLVTRQASLRLDEMGELVQARTRELMHVALHDRLTGLPNRELLMERLGQSVARHRRDGEKYAVLFLDFDRFKVINDSLGHRAGDLLLAAVAERLRGSLRETDSVCRPGEDSMAARIGGDEFVVLLAGLSCEHDAARVAARLLDILAEPWEVEGHTIRITASIGVTMSSVGYTDPHAILRDADTAMYRAKVAGKARYVIFNRQMHDEAVQRLHVEDDLRTAIGTDQFLLHYQPIVTLADARICGFEALVRWRHPSGRLIAPGEFVSLAEETGCIVPLGVWVLKEACRVLHAWRQRFPDVDLTMSVNLSRRQLASPELMTDIREAIASTGVAPHALKLEITESSIMEDREAAITRLQDIRAMGIGLDIDDFGTGYSSLSCLHQFPVSGLKIDREFVNNLSERSNHASVVRAIVTLAHILNVHVVAEGIETKEQLELLRGLECDLGQGHYFSRPVDAERAEALLTSRRPFPSEIAAAL